MIYAFLGEVSNRLEGKLEVAWLHHCPGRKREDVIDDRSRSFDFNRTASRWCRRDRDL